MVQKDVKTSVAAKKARKRGNQAAHNARLKEAAVMSGYPTIGKLAKAIRDGDVVVRKKRKTPAQARADEAAGPGVDAGDYIAEMNEMSDLFN